MTMTITNQHKNRDFCIIILILALFCLPLLNPSAHAEEKDSPKAVAVLPFKMHAPSNLAYLQEGLRDMLASRLAANTGAAIIDKKKINGVLTEPGKVLQKKEALDLGSQLAADYIITGSLTSLGGSMSLDAKVFSVADTVEPMSFYASAAKEDEVINAINQLSWDIAEKVFGSKRPASAISAPAVQPIPEEDKTGMAAFQTEHPEKAFMTQAPAGSVGMPGTAALIMPTAMSATRDFTKSQNLDLIIRGMDVGDVDGDGQLDVVLAGLSNVIVYHLVNNRLIEFGSVEMPARSRVHSVNLGDLDGNGKAEIYVSANDDNDPHSWAYEWDGSSLQVTLDDVPWFLRVLNIPGEGPVLLGQRGSRDNILWPGIFRLMKNDTGVMPEQRLVMPDYVNLFEFSMADVTGDGTLEIVATSRADRLYVVSPNGSVLWVSEDFYGGTSRYVGEDFDLVGRTGIDIDSQRSDDDPNKEGSGRRFFIPSRIVVMDVNQDGRDDILVNMNFSAASRHVDGYKRFKTGQLHAMTWNGIAMSGLWKTKKIDGYIPDFQFIPLPDQENRAKLFVGLVLSTGWTSSFSKGQSTMLSYNIELAEKKGAKGEPEN
jgi:TolB-like protein